MDMETEIQMLAQSMTGADQGEQDYLAALCAAQWERISQMLPEETESGRSRLICAAASLAAADYFNTKGAAGTASWSAGDVSVHNRDGASCAAAARELRAAGAAVQRRRLCLLGGAGMTESFADILRHFGARVEIEHENALAQTRAFVQLIRRQETKEPWEETNFGAADLRRWLYIGPKEQPLQAGDKVRAGGAAYVAQHAAAIYVGAEKSHWWGILRLEREGLV